MNLFSSSSSPSSISISTLARYRRQLLVISLAVGFGGQAMATEISPQRTEDLSKTDTDDSTIDDYADGGDDVGDPHPDPNQPHGGPGGIVSERDPLDPADDFWWEEGDDDLEPADDFKTEADHAEIWLTAAAPNHLMAYLTGDRVWHWDGNPANPSMAYRVDPSRPIEANANLEVHLRAQPGFEYDVYFWFGPSPSMNGARVAIDNLALGIHAEMAPVGTGWTHVVGPALGSDPDNHIISLSMAGWPDAEARWSVTTVQIVASPL
jgi:hypothetical protein